MSRPLSLVVLGLSLSSSWGNGHATTWRALLRAFAARGHDVLFLERERPWYASHRDLAEPDWCRLEIYQELEELTQFGEQIAAADAVIVGSYVPDGIRVGRHVQTRARGITAFYDIDTPVTLAALAAGRCEYLTPELVQGYDLYLSFSGGPVLQRLEQRHGARLALPLYCSVDPERYQPMDLPRRWDLSYLGTWSADRQPTLQRLLIEPARRLPALRFVVAGAQYPADIDWPDNVQRLDHVPPAEHAAFYAASRYTLNVTRADMIRTGWSPSVRLFEAGACATPVISDRWDGLDSLFRPDREILIADTSDDVVARLQTDDRETGRRIGQAARARILASHTAAHRAAELEAALTAAAALQPRAAPSIAARPLRSHA